MTDYKQFIFKEIRERGPIPTDEIVAMVESAFGRGKWTASNALTDICTLTNWGWISRSGVAESETLQVTEKGREVDADRFLTKLNVGN